MTPTGKKVVGHFVFNLTKSQLEKKLSRNFKKLFLNLKSRPNDIRMSSINNKMNEFEIYKAALLGIHTSINTTKNTT